MKIVSGAASGGAYLVVNPSINSAADLEGQDRGVAAARQHPGRRAAHLAEDEGPEHRHHRRRRRLRSGRRTTPPPSTRSRPVTSPARGCPSRGRPASSPKAAARSSSTRPTSGRRVKYVTTQLVVTTELPEGPPRRGAEAGERSGRGERLHQDQPVDAQTDVSNNIAKDHRQGRSRRPRDRVVQEHRVHQRPDRLVAGEEQQGRSKASRASRRPTASRASTTCRSSTRH